MELRQLRHVLEVMEVGSLGRAAERLRISQPALTKSIRRLETELGVALFQRDRRGMTPTLYAERLQGYARAASVGLAQSLAEMQAMKTGMAGAATVAAPPVLVGSLLPAAVARLTVERPDIQIRVLTEIDNLFPVLEDGRCDIVFAMAPKSERRFVGLQQKLLFDDEMVVIMRPDHPLAGTQALDPRSVTTARWALPLEGNILRARLNLIFEEAGLGPPRAAVECQAPELIKAVVRSTDYLGWAPNLACLSEAQNGTLARVRIKSTFARRQIGLFWREYHLSPTAAALVAAIEETCRETKSRFTLEF